MRGMWIIFLGIISTSCWGQACIVHSEADHLDVKVCEENRNIPSQLFAEGFCKPSLKGQKVTVSYAEHCPAGAFGVCSNAHVDNMPYRQDIHYYGVAADERFLQPFCAQKSQGVWIKP
ncbi:NADH:ubiquinone oxidoreductase [Pseudomonas typographi]|uniref:NADH:ubiquinone oxidoreductase n=1 Tax=Pseudomonas typographi TaxID=2715964 RepID=A0ABR7Z2F7_9PSED|nr:NADH:ubiquinone oxidoreductase [Pseudomonas typographi]MBD1550280.1 NADH:ubiquinone oxidoreductase [Pseudomonas typographi]MBD1585954.1 NADH:ubiquinone oxidoreductase [Pseudomonas typographi]MBD1599681.1 NADH:ubiquinone oxidoreductase [Pseudomonas typographi]